MSYDKGKLFSYFFKKVVRLKPDQPDQSLHHCIQSLREKACGRVEAVAVLVQGWLLLPALKIGATRLVSWVDPYKNRRTEPTTKIPA